MSELYQKVAKDISRLKKAKEYTPFKKGFFKNSPELEGYIFKFSSVGNKIYLVVNTNKNYKYDKNFTEGGDFSFIVYNSDSLEDFISELSKEAGEIIRILKKALNKGYESKEEKRQYNIPHGYYKDEDGNIKVDSASASEVRDIFKQYMQHRSIKKVAQLQNTNFSRIRDVLHDERYMDIQPQIVPTNIQKKVREIIYQNRKK